MLVDDIALTMQYRIGPATAAHLLSCFGTAENIFRATADELIERAELNPTVAAGIVRKECHRRAEKELHYCQKHGIIPLPSTSELYPPLLRECNDYPHVLYVKGDPSVLQRRTLSFVGTRMMTSYGQRMCNRLIEGLAAMFPDLVIVSGLASGVDGACHRAALASGLITVAVLPDPLPRISPAAHTQLAQEMLRCGGALVSEYHSGVATAGKTFVARNRIIAGMSEGTVVVESAAKGGSLITARLADGYNRTVMAVPGRADDRASEGTNRLIADCRAHLICSAEDIARELGWTTVGSTRVTEPAEPIPPLRGELRSVLNSIAAGETVSADELAERCGLPVQELIAMCLELEIEGLVRSLPGARYEKC